MANTLGGSTGSCPVQVTQVGAPAVRQHELQSGKPGPRAAHLSTCSYLAFFSFSCQQNDFKSQQGTSEQRSWQEFVTGILCHKYIHMQSGIKDVSFGIWKTYHYMGNDKLFHNIKSIRILSSCIHFNNDNNQYHFVNSYARNRARL